MAWTQCVCAGDSEIRWDPETSSQHHMLDLKSVLLLPRVRTGSELPQIHKNRAVGTFYEVCPLFSPFCLINPNRPRTLANIQTRQVVLESRTVSLRQNKHLSQNSKHWFRSHDSYQPRRHPLVGPGPEAESPLRNIPLSQSLNASLSKRPSPKCHDHVPRPNSKVFPFLLSEYICWWKCSILRQSKMEYVQVVSLRWVAAMLYGNDNASFPVV